MTGIADTISNPQDLPQDWKSRITHNMEDRKYISWEQKISTSVELKTKGLKHKEVSLEQLYNIENTQNPTNLLQEERKNFMAWTFRHRVRPNPFGN